MLVTAMGVALALVTALGVLVFLAVGGIELADRWFGLMGAVIYGAVFFFAFMTAAVYFFVLPMAHTGQ